MSQYWKGQGQRLTPLEYIEKNRNGFDQACTWGIGECILDKNLIKTMSI
jgi:hypothetical protein